METFDHKVGALSVLYMLTLLCGYLPAFLTEFNIRVREVYGRENILDNLNSFTGGVFLATCLLHLLAGGREDFEEALKISGVQPNYPIFDLIVAVGFFIIVLVVQIGIYCLPKDNDEQRSRPGPPPSDAEDEELPPGPIHRTPDDEVRQPLLGSIHRSPDNTDDEYMYMKKLKKVNSGINAGLLLIALSFSNVFDGLAVGLQDSTSDVWQITLAVGFKAVVISLSLGIQLFDDPPNPQSRTVILWFVFSLISPVGGAVGIGVTSGHIQQAPKLMTSALLQALASGICLYVTFLEILKNSLFGHKKSLWNVLSAVVGFGVIAGWKVVDRHKCVL